MGVLNCYSIKLNPLSLKPLPSLIDGFFNLNTFVMEKEIWKPIKGFKGKYDVSNKGRVRSLKNNALTKRKKPKILSQTSERYPRVCLSIDNDKNNCTVHRLVALAFIPNPENKPQVNHINGIKDDNRVKNLEWCTHSENELHASENGLKARGERHGCSKLTKKDVLHIRKVAREGGRYYGQKELAEKYNVSTQAIQYIVKRVNWSHI